MHKLIIGMTMSGKTTLAKKLVKTYQSKGINCLVLDPLNDPTWCASFQTNDPKKFLDTVFHPHSRSCALFVDESGASIGRYAGDMQILATQSRHLGHKAHFITQRATQLDPTMRDQCDELFLFRVGYRDAKTFSEEFGYDDIMKAPQLSAGQFYRVGRFSQPVLCNAFENKT